MGWPHPKIELNHTGVFPAAEQPADQRLDGRVRHGEIDLRIHRQREEELHGPDGAGRVSRLAGSALWRQ